MGSNGTTFRGVFLKIGVGGLLATSVVAAVGEAQDSGDSGGGSSATSTGVVQTAVIDESYGYLNLSQRGGRPANGGGGAGGGSVSLQPASMTASFSNFELNGIAFDDWQGCRANHSVDDCLAELGDTLRERHPGAIGGDTFAFDLTIENTSTSAVLTSFAFQSKFSESPALGSRIGDKLFAAERVGPVEVWENGGWTTVTDTDRFSLVGVKKNGTSNGLYGGKVKGICINSSTDYPSDLNLGVENETLECAGGRRYDRDNDRPVLDFNENGLPKGLQPGQKMRMRLLLDAGTDDGALQRAFGGAAANGSVGPLVGTLKHAGEFRPADRAEECLELDVRQTDNVLDVVNYGDVKIIRDKDGKCAPSFEPFWKNQFLTIPRRNWGFTDILDTRDDYLAHENPTPGQTGKFSFLDVGNLKPGQMNFFEILRGFGEHGDTLDPSCKPGGSRQGSCGGAAYVPWAEFYARSGSTLVRQEVAGGYGHATYVDGPQIAAAVATGSQTSCSPNQPVKCKVTDPSAAAGTPNAGPPIGAKATATFSDVEVIADDPTTIPNEGGQAGGNKVRFTVTITNTSQVESNIYLTSFNFQTKRRGLTDINILDGTTIQGRQDLRVGPVNPSIGFGACGTDPLEAVCYDTALGIGRFPNVIGNSLLSSKAISGLQPGKLNAIKKNGTFQPLMRVDNSAANFICIKSGDPAPDQDADETCSGKATGGSGEKLGLAPGESQSVRLELDYGDFRGLILRVQPGTLVPQGPPFGLLEQGGDFDCSDQRRLPFCHPVLANSTDPLVKRWFTMPITLEEVEFVTVHQPGDAATVMDFEQNFGYLLAMAGFVPTAEFWQGGTQMQVKGEYLVKPPPPSTSNQPPTAVITYTCEALACAFDGAGSTDPDGTIVRYEWDFGDGSSATDTSPTVVYGAYGTYTVKLTVTDDEGVSGSTQVVVVLKPPNELPSAAFTDECDELVCTFDAEDSTDPDGTIVTYAWTFFQLDGQGDETQVGERDGKVAVFEFPGAGDYVVRLLVTDDSAGTGLAERTLAVAGEPPPPNEPPTAVIAEPVACTFLTCTLDGSGSYDPDGSISAWSWTVSQGQTQIGTASGQTAEIVLPDAGSYTVTLTVTDNLGASHSTDADIVVSAPPSESQPNLEVLARKVRGLQEAVLTWSGFAAPETGSSEGFDVYRDGIKIATVPASPYLDQLNSRGRGTYVYRVCRAGTTSTCTNTATAVFG